MMVLTPKPRVLLGSIVATKPDSAVPSSNTGSIRTVIGFMPTLPARHVITLPGRSTGAVSRTVAAQAGALRTTTSAVVHRIRRPGLGRSSPLTGLASIACLLAHATERSFQAVCPANALLAPVDREPTV